MKTTEFRPDNIIQRLVNHYGLPAFLFTPDAQGRIALQGSKTIVPVAYAQYDRIPQLPVSPRTYYLFEDLWRSRSDIVASQISRHAGYHEKIFARSCRLVRIEKQEAEHFLARYHLMGSAQAAFHYGLVHQKQIVAVASFSRGRKMDRLPNGNLSFELIRLATLPNLTVTGSISRFIRHFQREHQPGDVMTYVDRLLGDKSSFEKNGFVLHGTSRPVTLWVNTRTHERLFRPAGDGAALLSFSNQGNDKLIKTF